MAMTGLGKPVSNLDASEKEPGIELKPAGKAAAQSGMTEIQQGKAEKGKNLITESSCFADKTDSKNA